MTDFRPTRFNILPLVIKNLLIINGLIYLAQVTLPKVLHLGPYFLDDMFALHYWGSPLFRPYQLVTHMFMHGSIPHIFFNMFALWMFGNVLENIWGPKRFLIFYMICGLGAALCQELSLTWEYHQLSNAFAAGQASYQDLANFMYSATLGASGAIFGVLVAFGYLFPNSMIYIYFFLPMKAKYFVAIYIILELYLGIRNSAGDNIAHFAHLGGALVGFILLKIWNRKNRKTFY